MGSVVTRAMAVQVVNSNEMGSLFRRVSVEKADLFVQGTPYGPLASTTILGFSSRLFFQVGFTTSPKHNTNPEIDTLSYKHIINTSKGTRNYLECLLLYYLFFRKSSRHCQEVANMSLYTS